MVSRSDLINRIADERDRQFNLPGSERDVRNTPNDFIATACRYLSEEARRFDNLPLRADYEASLIKAAAVILAALESTSAMQARGHFRDAADPEFTQMLNALAETHRDENSPQTIG